MAIFSGHDAFEKNSSTSCVLRDSSKKSSCDESIYKLPGAGQRQRRPSGHVQVGGSAQSEIFCLKSLSYQSPAIQMAKPARGSSCKNSLVN